MMIGLDAWLIMSQNVWWQFRIAGVEDGGFSKAPLTCGVQKALLVCVLLHGMRIEDFRAVAVTVDGLDASEKLVSMLRGLSFDAIMLAGVSFAGFNLIDPVFIFEVFSKPVIVVSRTRPDNLAVKGALFRHFEDWQIRWRVFEKIGPIHEVVSMPSEPPLYVEVVGADLNWTSDLIRAFTVCSRVPEPVRVARLIAQGLTRQ